MKYKRLQLPLCKSFCDVVIGSRKEIIDATKLNIKDYELCDDALGLCDSCGDIYLIGKPTDKTIYHECVHAATHFLGVSNMMYATYKISELLASFCDMLFDEIVELRDKCQD